MIVLTPLLAAAVIAADPEIPEIANRFQVSGYAFDKEPEPDKAVFNRDTRFPEIQRIMLDPAETPRRKAEAANFWSGELSAAYDNPRPEFWEAVDRTFELMDALFALPPGPAERRHSIGIIFSNLVAQIRGAVVDTPADKGWRPRWSRARALVRRGLKDSDPVLQANFERYQNLPKHPDWKKIKTSMRAAHLKLEKQYPKDDLLPKVWKLCQSMEDEQLKQKAEVEARYKAKKFGLAVERKLQRYQKHLYDYRFYTIWASQYPSVMAEGMGEAEAAKLGIKALPVRNGWPDVK